LRFAPEDSEMALGSELGLGFVDFTMWVHVDNPNPIFEEHTMANVEKWAREIPVPTYAIDDQTAIKVDNGIVDVVSEGHWKLFTPKS
jgi:dipeptidase E